MEAERGGHDGWKIEKCYTQEYTKEMLDIVAGKFFVCAAPSDSENFKGLSDEQMQKYMETVPLSGAVFSYEQRD